MKDHGIYFPFSQTYLVVSIFEIIRVEQPLLAFSQILGMSFTNLMPEATKLESNDPVMLLQIGDAESSPKHLMFFYRVYDLSKMEVPNCFVS